jgi:hypothetical protein
VQDRKQSPIFVKTYDLLLWLLERSARFPKHERFRMARRLEESAFAFYDLLLQAGRLGDGRDRDKRRLLLQADLELDRLRFHVRMCQDLKLLSFNFSPQLITPSCVPAWRATSPTRALCGW